VVISEKDVNLKRLFRLLVQYALAHLSAASNQVHRRLAAGGGQSIDSFGGVHIIQAAAAVNDYDAPIGESRLLH